MGVNQIAPQRWLGRFFEMISLHSNTMPPEPEAVPGSQEPTPGKISASPCEPRKKVPLHKGATRMQSTIL
jgi:hypothetical protein